MQTQFQCIGSGSLQSCMYRQLNTIHSVAGHGIGPTRAVSLLELHTDYLHVKILKLVHLKAKTEI